MTETIRLKKGEITIVLYPRLLNQLGQPDSFPVDLSEMIEMTNELAKTYPGIKFDYSFVQKNLERLNLWWIGVLENKDLAAKILFQLL